jgi:hypothetical protein
MLLKDSSRTKNNQELVKASIDALVKALEGLVRCALDWFSRFTMRGADASGAFAHVPRTMGSLVSKQFRDSNAVRV